MRFLTRLTTKTLVFAGFAALIALIFFAGDYRSFLNMEGLIVVVGGSIANAFLSFKRQDVYKAFTAIRHLFRGTEPAQQGLHRDIVQLIMWSYVVQAQDFIGLEKESAKTIREPLLRYGVDLVVTGYDPNEIRDMLHTVVEAEFERRSLAVTVLRNMAATAPAFGMVGTLIGMILIMGHVGTDIAAIGSGLGFAMLATLYGLLFARLVCLPAADKLLQHEEAERDRNYMLAEGLGLIAEKKNPYYIQDKLNSFLDPANHFDLFAYMKRLPRRTLALAA